MTTTNKKQLKLTQNAYVTNDDTYQATALDDAHNRYTVEWTVTNYNCNDESDACDWDRYLVLPLYTCDVIGTDADYTLIAN